ETVIMVQAHATADAIARHQSKILGFCTRMLVQADQDAVALLIGDDFQLIDDSGTTQAAEERDEDWRDNEAIDDNLGF
ncbi:unnamed protein product, partial [marine sediment metagenome]